MTTLGATVERLVLSTPDVDALAAFYRRAFEYEVQAVGSERRCEGPQRSLWLRPGPANQLAEVHFRFGGAAAYQEFCERLQTEEFKVEWELGAGGIALSDPDGRRLRFHHGNAPSVTGTPGGRLQHFAVRSPNPKILVDFYVDRLGFVVSDTVRDDSGELTAVFLRTDAEHHALAIFRSPEARFDHLSHETDNWRSLRDWADHMAAVRTPMVWGVGRHGPGNDLFFMVKDPDGNMAEISAELEVCDDGRPAGCWPHEQRTLNLWGVAIMRS